MIATPEMASDFRIHWTRCAPWIEEALDGTYSLGDVLIEILEERAQLWPMPKSVCVTQIHDYPRMRVLRIWLAGGDLEDLRRHIPAIDSYAREQNCARVELVGRKGWAKVLPGYSNEFVVLTKDVRLWD